MDFTEKQIEDLLYENLNPVGLQMLSERGLGFIDGYEHFERQVDLGKYGRADLIGFHYVAYDKPDKYGCRGEVSIGVIELKKGEINSTTLLQAVRYVTALVHVFNKIKMHASFKIHLIGSSVSIGDFIYVTNVFENVSLHTISLDLVKGIRFANYSDIGIVNPGFQKGTSFKSIKSYFKKTIYSVINQDEIISNYKISLSEREHGNGI